MGQSTSNKFKEWILETSKEPDDWSGLLSLKLHKKLNIELLSCVSDFEGFVKIDGVKPLHAKKLFDYLRNNKHILDYDLGTSQGGKIAVWVKAKQPTICKNIQDSKFKLSGDIEVVDGVQHFIFKSFYDDKITKNRITKLQNTLSSRGVLIKRLRERPDNESIPHTIPKFKFDKEYQKVIELLIKSNYFDQSKRTMTQEEISKTSGISVGKINKIIRTLQKEGFKTMMSFYPDLTKFESKMKNLIKKDKEKYLSAKNNPRIAKSNF